MCHTQLATVTSVSKIKTCASEIRRLDYLAETTALAILRQKHIQLFMLDGVTLHRSHESWNDEFTFSSCQQLKLATALRSTLFTFAANRRLQRLSWKWDVNGLQQTIARVFELPPKLF